MSKGVVVMACLPGVIQRGTEARTGIDYAKYGRATWKWWCEQNNLGFIVLDRPLGGEPFQSLPPTIQRWLAPTMLLKEFGENTRLMLVDADTMVKWDAPNLFDLSGSRLAAARGVAHAWIKQSIDAYRGLFPGVELRPSDYFNTGLVILGRRQIAMLDAFTEFVMTRWPELYAIQRAGDFGSDQTPLNFIAHREREPIRYLPYTFNMVHCDFAVSHLISNTPLAAQRHLFQGASSAFDFISKGYVWHFTASYRHRYFVMEEVWRRVCDRYPGASLADVSSME